MVTWSSARNVIGTRARHEAPSGCSLGGLGQGLKQSVGVSGNHVVHATPRLVSMMCRFEYGDAKHHAIGDRV